MSKNDRFVTQRGDKWAVVAPHAKRASAIKAAQAAAGRVGHALPILKGEMDIAKMNQSMRSTHWRRCYFSNRW